MYFFRLDQCIARIHFGTEADAVGMFEFPDAFFGKALAPQPYNVDSIGFCLISISHRSDEGECIARNHGKTADKCMMADATELMHGRKCSNRCMVSNRDVPRKGGGIRHDHVVSNKTIVGYVAVGHEKISVSNNRNPVSSPGPAIQADEFPENVIASDLQVCDFAFVFKILRIRSNRAVAVKTAPFSDVGPAMNINMGIQHAAGPDVRVRTNDTVGADMGFRGNFTGFVYDCRRMYGHCVNKLRNR